MKRDRGLTLLDLIVVLALVALLAWLVRLDVIDGDARPAAPVPATLHVPG